MSKHYAYFGTLSYCGVILCISGAAPVRMLQVTSCARKTWLLDTPEHSPRSHSQRSGAIHRQVLQVIKGTSRNGDKPEHRQFETVPTISSSFSVQGSVFRHIDALLGEFRVGGVVHDSYTFQCGLVESFTSPGIVTPDRRDRRLLVSPPKDTSKAG